MLELGVLVDADVEDWPPEQDYCTWEGVTCDTTVNIDCNGRVKDLTVPPHSVMVLLESNLLSSLCLQSIVVATNSGSKSSSLVGMLTFLQKLPPNIMLVIDEQCCGGDRW